MTATRQPEETVQIEVTAPVARALWSAVWALEDSLGTVRRMQKGPFPPAYAAPMIEQAERDLSILRDLLRDV